MHIYIRSQINTISALDAIWDYEGFFLPAQHHSLDFRAGRRQTLRYPLEFFLTKSRLIPQSYPTLWRLSMKFSTSQTEFNKESCTELMPRGIWFPPAPMKSSTSSNNDFTSGEAVGYTL